MQKKESVKSNFIYNTIYQILILLVPLVTTPYVSRVLGADNIGIYSYNMSIVSYFTVISAFGSTTLGQRNIAFYQNNKQERSQVFWNVFSFRFLMSVVAIIIFVGIQIYSKRTLSISLLFTINILDVALDISWFFQGCEKFKQIVLRNLIIKLIGCILIFTLVKTKSHLWIYILINSGALILGDVSLWMIVPSLISKVRKIHPFLYVKDMWSIFLPTIAVQLYAVLDKSMLGWIVKSNYENGCYEQADKIVRVALAVVTSIGTVLMPRIAYLYHNRDKMAIKSYISSAYNLTWMLSLPMAFGIIAVASVFVPLFFGDGYDRCVELLILLSVLVIIVGLANTTGRTYLIPTEQQNIYTVSVSIAAVVNLVLNYFLIKEYSSIGAAVSTIIAEGTGCLIQIGYCIRTRQIEISDLFHNLWKYITSSVLMYFVIVVIKRWTNTSSVLSLGLMIGCGIIIYFGGLIILKEENCMNYLLKFKQKLIGRKAK